MRGKPLSLRLADSSVPLALLCVLAAGGCDHPVGPEDAATLPHPALVSVELEYVQPAACITSSPSCSGRVVFFASWLPPGSEFALVLVPGTRIWRATADDVPVNYPPRGQPYEVQIFDPFIAAGATEGITANRITLGGEFLTRYTSVGTTSESALVFIDVNGQGHNGF